MGGSSRPRRVAARTTVVAVVLLLAVGVGGFVVRRATGEQVTVPTVASTLPPVATVVPVPLPAGAPTTTTATLPEPVATVLTGLGVADGDLRQAVAVDPAAAADAGTWMLAVEGSTSGLPGCGAVGVVCGEAGPGPAAGTYLVVVVPTRAVAAGAVEVGAVDAPSIAVAFRDAVAAVVGDPTDPNVDTSRAVEVDLAAGSLVERTWTGTGYETAAAAGRAVVGDGAVTLLLPVADPSIPFRTWIRTTDGATVLAPSGGLVASTTAPVAVP